MKKKPPPGATLIARMKEQRLAREAELARRRQEAEGGAAAAPGEENAGAQQASVEAVPPAAPPALQSENDAPTTTVTAVVVETQAETRHEIAISPQQAPAASLLNRPIDIADLRPDSDDYFILTDEIRLAGRFAAAGLIAQGLRLWRIKDAQIHKDHYPTFEEYCRREHQMTATYAYRLIRMADMAEQVARTGTAALADSSEAMPDPFEVLISLGHRHLLALLPLPTEAAQDLLLHGIPLKPDSNGGESERVPLSKATEKQIRQALRSFAPAPTKTVVKVEKQALVSEKQLIPALSKLVEMLEDWSLWLEGDPPAELQAARMGRGQLLHRLAKRFRSASGKIADALEGGEES